VRRHTTGRATLSIDEADAAHRVAAPKATALGRRCLVELAGLIGQLVCKVSQLESLCEQWRRQINKTLHALQHATRRNVVAVCCLLYVQMRNIGTHVVRCCEVAEGAGSIKDLFWAIAILATCVIPEPGQRAS